MGDGYILKAKENNNINTRELERECQNIIDCGKCKNFYKCFEVVGVN